jgi:outer membrane protein OmpA-like peptidoglycan-associated protein
MNIVTKRSLATVAFTGLLLSCATTVPPELVQARASYAASNNGLAAKLTPAELNEAAIALAKANKELEDHGNTAVCRDYAYIAQRKVELADAKARTELDRQKIADAAKAGVAARDAQVKNTRAALESTREQLDEARRDNSTKTAEIAKTADQLEAEKQARSTAEGRLASAMNDLARIAAVKEESRGLVITLSGSILFASNKYTLLDTARTKLDQVAEALKAQQSDKRMVVEGHTDSRGSEQSNQALSLNRANAVRDYLVSRGVDSDKITAVGKGASQPLVDNKTAENRANNRRVEIVVQPSHMSVH